MINKKFVSVIVPVYNQSEALIFSLHMYNLQDYPKELFEVIVVDDGSNDTEFLSSSEFLSDILYNLKVIRQKNSGRAVARNTGVINAKGDYLIFSDADRFPNERFISSYVKCLEMDENKILIGCPMDFFGKLSEDYKETDWKYIKRYSRISPYFKKIINMYEDDGNTVSKIAWASFLVGNSAMCRQTYNLTDGFFEGFTKWGFEHFELGFRLMKKGGAFKCCIQTENYHISHSRGNEFYRECMKESIDIMNEIHYGYNFESLLKFMFGEISLQQFEKEFSGQNTNPLMLKEEIYFKL